MAWQQILPVIFPIVIALVVLGAMFSLRYRITEAELQIRILGMPVRKIKLRDIAEIKKGKALLGENWAAPLPGREMVVITKKKGLVKNINITPPEADAFIAEAKAKIASLPPDAIEPGKFL
ncbi:MAG: hypothetical protein PHE84_14520 [bacterium]|nr:hypothetical protein [bacterium]